MISRLKKITITLISIILSCLCFINNETISAKADQSTEFIGKYALTSNVSSLTKVYINLNDKEFVESTGREVFYEWVEELPEVGVMNNSLVNSFVIHPIVKKYYYFADSNHPKITNIINLYNDIDSLKIILAELEEKANNFGLVGASKVNAILGYIRSFRLDYNNNSNLFKNYWGYIAGEINQNFIDYIDLPLFSNHGLKIKDYFASFTSSSSLNLNIHPGIGDDYQNFNFEMIDSITNNHFDLIHMFASVDGIYSNTGASYVNDIFFYNDEQHDLISWAGDLQTEESRLSYNNTYSFRHSMNEIFNDNFSTFSFSDFLSDVIAFVLTKNYIDINDSILTSLNSFYSDILTYQQMINNFIDKVIEGYSINGANRSILLKYVVNKFSAISFSYDSFDNCEIYSDSFISSKRLYSLLKKYDNHPSYDARRYISTLFFNYLNQFLYE